LQRVVMSLLLEAPDATVEPGLRVEGPRGVQPGGPARQAADSGAVETDRVCPP
jgi:hypothetical protein